MSSLMFILLFVAFLQTFPVDGQSTIGSREDNEVDVDILNTILNEVRYYQNRDHFGVNVCTQIEDLVKRQLNNITQTLESLEVRLERLVKTEQTAASVGQDVRSLSTCTWSRDCADIRKLNHILSGVYHVSSVGPGFNQTEISVFCDLKSSDASWLVFQRRQDGSENFERTWEEYQNGFGNLTGEFWLGNNALHLLTSNRNYKLRIELEDLDGNKTYAEYAQFSVGPASDNYRLNIYGYSGNAGDDMRRHNGMMFSTKDADHDTDSGNCAQRHRGAWWFSGCFNAHLNGLYLRGIYTSCCNGVVWKSFRGLTYSLKYVEMKIAPRS